MFKPEIVGSDFGRIARASMLLNACHRHVLIILVIILSIIVPRIDRRGLSLSGSVYEIKLGRMCLTESPNHHPTPSSIIFDGVGLHRITAKAGRGFSYDDSFPL